MPSRRSVVSGLVVGLATLGCAVPAAQAQTPPRTWPQETYSTLTEKAGDVCDFALRIDPVRQDVRYKTFDSYADGAPRDQLYAGPLYERFTNLATGASFVGNVSGTAFIHYDSDQPDATQRWLAIGPIGVTFHAGNPYHRRGEYIVGGVTRLIVHGGTVSELAAHRGPTTDVCAALTR